MGQCLNRMAFRDISGQSQGVQLLQRSLARGRLGHAYLFTGDQLEDLEILARSLAKTLNCLQPVKTGGIATDCCDECANCRKIADDLHADVHWARPESKSRVITIDQMRDLMQQIQLKPTETGYKIAVIAGADRLNVQAANAFLKTLEEPPPKSILILLSTEPARLLETILSRCLRLNFSAGTARPLPAAQAIWLQQFSAAAAGEQKSLFGRYRLLDSLLQHLNTLRAGVEEALSARSPLEKYTEVEKDLREKWEDELAAAVEAEYRRQRAEVLRQVGDDPVKFRERAAAQERERLMKDPEFRRQLLEELRADAEAGDNGRARTAVNLPRSLSRVSGGSSHMADRVSMDDSDSAVFGSVFNR